MSLMKLRCKLCIFITMKNYFVLVFGVIIPLFGLAQPKMSAYTKQILHKTQGLTDKETHLLNIEEDFSAQNKSDRNFISAILKVNEKFNLQLLPPFAIVGSRINNIITLKIPTEHIDKVLEIPHIIHFEIARKIAPNIHQATIDLRANLVNAQPFWQGNPVTGKDVIIGVTDWGFDLTHPMFYDTSMQNYRVIGLWDQFKKAGNPPQGYNYGVEIIGEQNLVSYQHDTASTYYDLATHGSHVAGIAGGGGAGVGLKGIAYNAEFLFAHFYLDEASAIDAVHWMKTKADQLGKRLVVNMSWGLYHIGTLDGSGLLSEVLNDLSDQGVVFVTSAGNNGDTPFHIKKTFNNDTIFTKVNFYDYSAHPSMWGQNVIMWGTDTFQFAANIKVYNGNVLETQSEFYFTKNNINTFDTILLAGNDSIFIKGIKEKGHPLNNKPYIHLQVKNTQVLKRVVLTATAPKATVHFFNITHLSNGAGNWGMPFAFFGPGSTLGDANFSIGEPACTEKIITVGAHSSEINLPNGTTIDGDIASFSSIGPALSMLTKPEVTAPGVNVESSVSSFTTRGFTPSRWVNFQGKSYPFSRFSGTSMSSPAVAGVVALMLEINPDLTPDEVKQILISTARQDAKTGIIPDSGSTVWGYGKVNAFEACKKVVQLSYTDQQILDKQFQFFPNPTRGQLFHFGIKENEIVAVYNALGLMVLQTKMQLLTLEHLPPGAYFIKYQLNKNEVTEKVIRF